MNQLPDSTLVVAYHLNKKNLIEISFNNQDLFVYTSPIDDEFHSNLRLLRTSLSDWKKILSNREASKNNIDQHSKYVGEYLFKTIKQYNNDPNHIIIMPNGALNIIPFELLKISGSNQNLIREYSVSYAYLFSTLPQKNKTSPQTSSFGGFAPKYSTYSTYAQGEKMTPEFEKLALRSGLVDIPEARKSVLNLSKTYGGDAWVKDKANKSTFIEKAKDYDVLHLGMHSLMNNETSELSCLVFSEDSDNKLFLKEVQSMDIPASMVVLSACNTGVGRNVVGEGSLSLARAFFYAGSKSVLMSLWQVPDVQTARIMNLFYKNLDNGYSKNESLTLAKREYLKTASSLESHPAFWSGFVLVGDVSPLQFANPFPIFSIASLLILSLFGIVLSIVYVKRKPRNRP